MKNKSYIYDPKKHDVSKIKRCLYTPDYVAEVNNPISAVKEIPMEGEPTLDQKIQEIMRRTLAKKAAQAERNSVEDITEAWDFDTDDVEVKTPFEYAAEALDTQDLGPDDEIPPSFQETELLQESESEAAVPTTPEPTIAEPPAPEPNSPENPPTNQP